uniref:T6SS Phospholipase effector Tle1-like catalytic domain-containing protein n=1 Tax=Aureoumbra lagunensis TaxID=44058 RepID=A0A7S3JV35_9STRA|mmetsp:Transcript_1437/g.1890  ORF Transcript_1437/g.1890 Transcript_1437/m.1890 type:complete len:566 (+) Transcript_1437:167-1864(+)|eukprot:CAMPEP_0197298928 /NCGR_PEP_ID=MMETSP0890-20130614/44787_1 /TAXON_ID=44058 ORGANISM="Aureoumbra lagunensis, Strain CCMP1510" /NCGR_SAMPLE_ID=MMETSP0890 /ASSEMBLY_ACC=CAM_ASM_000533 /LENGTH=565 /DNA_ID=CAMNT_0042776971 /DNA_START=61 /DNA_END=1758 /DNA_ORIENTATION=+
MPKIVILCDGTGNELCGDLSNVAKLYMSCVRDENQIVYYDTGLGTSGDGRGQSFWSQHTLFGKCRAIAKKIFGLATGSGLRRKVLAAYEFLVKNHQDGDEIYLIGFSRGAYTVRVVAAMIRVVGLLRPEQVNLCHAAFNAYMDELKTTNARGKTRRNSSADPKEQLSAVEQYQSSFRRRARSKAVPIQFVGLWDTVSSVLILDNILCCPIITRLRTLPYTMENCIVKTWRHALALDERRVMFIADRIHESSEGYRPIPWEPAHGPQDVKEVWFAGYHGDIGGGYAESESHLSKYPLLWLLRQAQHAGLRCHEYYVDRYARGIPIPNIDRTRQGKYGPEMDAEFVPPCTLPCKFHSSLEGAWHVVEYVPQRVKKERTNQRGCCCGLCYCYLHRGERRVKHKQHNYCYETSSRDASSTGCCACCYPQYMSKDNDENWVLDFTIHYSALQKHEDPADPYYIVDLPPRNKMLVEGPETDDPPPHVDSTTTITKNQSATTEETSDMHCYQRDVPPSTADDLTTLSSPSTKLKNGLDDDFSDEKDELVSKNNPGDHHQQKSDIVSIHLQTL